MKTLVAEDESLSRNLLIKVCKKEFALNVVAEAADGLEALELCRRHSPQLLLLDVVLPKLDGIQVAEHVLKEIPHARILILSSQCTQYNINRALELGIHGIFDKTTETVASLKKAIQTVTSGQRFFSKIVPKIRQTLMEDPLAFPKILSRREQEMLFLFAKGLSNQVISQQTGISPKTAQGHRHNIMKKLEIHDTPALMRYAIEKGFWPLNGV